ncbi:FK506-binding protein 5-like isoform X3 [Dendropsophus ebraccatus]|uniref:FK506-binding protein 5-like isoform X3 n=1 Tax=Dendropsophus ebraccatus TaxID=150705 RepID=UPI003831AA0D
MAGEEPKMYYVDMDPTPEDMTAYLVVHRQYVREDDFKEDDLDLWSEEDLEEDEDDILDVESEEDLEEDILDVESDEDLEEEILDVDNDEDNEEWLWRRAVMTTPWKFRRSKYPQSSWIPRLETIMSEEDLEEDILDVESDEDLEEEILDLDNDEDNEEWLWRRAVMTTPWKFRRSKYPQSSWIPRLETIIEEEEEEEAAEDIPRSEEDLEEDILDVESDEDLEEEILDLDNDEDNEEWLWRRAVMTTPWKFRRSKYPQSSWIPRLETIIEEEEEEEAAEDIPRSEEDLEEDILDVESDEDLEEEILDLDDDEDNEEWLWRRAVMTTPWKFRRSKYPQSSWIPRLETIIEEEEEEEEEAAEDIPRPSKYPSCLWIPRLETIIEEEEEEEAAEDIPREDDEEEEEEEKTIVIPRSSSRRSILSSCVRHSYHQELSGVEDTHTIRSCLEEKTPIPSGAVWRRRHPYHQELSGGGGAVNIYGQVRRQ